MSAPTKPTSLTLNKVIISRLNTAANNQPRHHKAGPNQSFTTLTTRVV